MTIHAPVERDVSGVRFVRGMLEVCDVRLVDADQYSCVLSANGAERDRADFDITVTTEDGECMHEVILFL